ncbi:hypothetical protein [Nitrosomonas communis]|uniref:hypothetical protein n=1 Tax=Nitrosomonas communis TaxID=44574 RepID=UPI003D2C3693
MRKTVINNGTIILKTVVGRGGAYADQGARQGAMRPQGSPLQRRATPHSRLERHAMHHVAASPFW